MQILSYQQWYHFASFIISIALLGFGLSSVVVIRLKSFFGEDFHTKIFYLIVFAAFSGPFVIITPQKLFGNFDSILLFSDFSEWGKLLFISLLFTFHFTVLALLILFIFNISSENFGKIYFFNLVGSGLGGFCAILLLWVLSPFIIIVLNGILHLFLALFFIKKDFQKTKFIFFNFVGIILIVLLTSPLRIEPSQFKSISRLLKFPDSKIIYEKVSPFGFIQVLSSKFFRYAGGISMSNTSEVPQVDLLLVNGENTGAIINKLDSSQVPVLTRSILFVPFYMKKHEKVLIPVSSGNVEILRATFGKSDSIFLIELNPIIQSLIQKSIEELYIINKTEVKIIRSDLRNFLKRTKNKFDLILHPPIEPVGSTAGLYTVDEKYILTKEAFALFLETINDQGYFSISVYIDYPYRAPLKLMNLLKETKKSSKNSGTNIELIAIKNWNLITFILKKGVFNKTELERLKDFSEENQFDIIISPDENYKPIEIYNQLIDTSLTYYLNSIWLNNNIENNYPFNIKSPTDNSPFFSNFIKLNEINFLLNQFSTRNLTYLEIGYFLIWMILFLVIFLASILLVFASIGVKIEKKVKCIVIIYFAIIGLAYMIFELVMIQKMKILLSNEIYSVALVICALLISSGFGSLLSEKISFTKYTLQKIFFLIALLIFLFALSIDHLINISLRFPLGIKLLVSLISITLPGLFMGMPFPLGIKFFATRNENIISLAYGVNGTFSVIGSSLAIVLAINLGFNFVIIVSSILYALNLIFLIPLKR